MEERQTMKRQLCTLVLTGLLATGVMLAQEPGSAPEQGAAPQAEGGGMGGHHHGRGMMDPDQRLAHMTKRYKLTADQQSQIKPILADEQTQMQAMRADTTTSRDDKRSKMMSMHQASTQKIEAVMTDDQKQKFEADQQKMQERRAEHGHGGQDGGPGGPPPDAGGAPPQQ
jgi:periplasmic protein CpxP/Spy